DNKDIEEEFEEKNNKPRYRHDYPLSYYDAPLAKEDEVEMTSDEDDHNMITRGSVTRTAPAQPSWLSWRSHLCFPNPHRRISAPLHSLPYLQAAMAFTAPKQLLRPQIHSSAAPPRRKHPSSDRSMAPKPSIFGACKKSLAAFSTSAVSFAAAAGGGFILLASSPPPPIDGGGGGGWYRGGGGGGDGGGFWANLFSPMVALAKDEGGAGQEWDPHGLPANIVVQLNKLSGLKRYKISDILFFDRRRSTTVAGTEDSFFEMVSLRNGGVYTKAQLHSEVENLAASGMFEKVDLEAKTKPDGTLALTVSFAESTWQSADAFRCINVGLLPQTKQMEMDPDMTDKEKLDYFRSQEREYRRRIDRSRSCLLPVMVRREVLQMLREQGKVSARLLQRIRDRVQKWYQDEGYACAQVVNFGNLNTKEVVCEVVEGDITQLEIQFLDKLGNLCEGNTQVAVIRRELPRQV
ncbi:hypothetical protein B296_00023014, partial [Ensete ventricosum]